MDIPIVLTMGEFLWALVGTVWTIRGFVTGCLEPDKLSFTDAPLIAVFVVIIITWIGRKCTKIDRAFQYRIVLVTFNIFYFSIFEQKYVYANYGYSID